MHAFCHAVPGAWHAMGVMLSAAGSLQWLRDRVAPDASFDELRGRGRRWQPGVEGLSLPPYLSGERTPHADPDARRRSSASRCATTGAPRRAVLEGVAYGLRDSLELLRELGVDVDRRARLRAAARRDALARDRRLGARPPARATAVEEGSAFGAALLGGVAAGVFATSRRRSRCVRVRETDRARQLRSGVPDDEGYARYRRSIPR